MKRSGQTRIEQLRLMVVVTLIIQKYNKILIRDIGYKYEIEKDEGCG
jgi:hypothetical protein